MKTRKVNLLCADWPFLLRTARERLPMNPGQPAGDTVYGRKAGAQEGERFRIELMFNTMDSISES